MRAYLATSFLGSFAFDKDGALLEKRLFPKKPEEIAKKLATQELLPEEEDILRALIAKGFKEVFTEKHAQFKGISLIHEPDNIGKKTLQENYRGLAVRLKWVTSQAELNELLNKIQVTRTKQQLRVERKDIMIIRTVGIVGELEKELNTLTEQVREWYGLHFPELSREVGSHEAFLKEVAEHGHRINSTHTELSKSSSGMDFGEDDIAEVQAFAAALLELYKRKGSLTAYIEDLGKEIMPNTTAVAGSLLGARMLAAAGSLEKMARLPSSTIQILGAEKALFRHLKGEGKAPKFGLLYAHPLIQNAPQERKGKVARLIAAKISLAARTDFYAKEDKGEQLRSDLEAQIGT